MKNIILKLRNLSELGFMGLRGFIGFLSELGFVGLVGLMGFLKQEVSPVYLHRFVEIFADKSPCIIKIIKNLRSIFGKCDLNVVLIISIQIIPKIQ